MTIEYTILDILKILLKKWYIILFFAIVFALITIPIANSSYKSSLTQYENNTNFDYLLAQAEKQIASIEDISKDIVDVDIIDITTFGYKYATFYLLVDAPNIPKEGEMEYDYVSGITMLISKDDVLIQLYNSISTVYAGTFESFKACISTVGFSESNTVSVDIANINEESFSVLLDKIPAILNEYTASLYDDVTVAVKYSKHDLMPNTPNEQLIENMDAMQIATEKLAYNKVILKKPTLKSTSVKIALVSALGGILFAVFLIIVIDYLKYNKKLNARKKDED